MSTNQKQVYTWSRVEEAGVQVEEEDEECWEHGDDDDDDDG